MVDHISLPAVRDGYHQTLELAALFGVGVSVHVPGEQLTGTVVVLSDSDVLLETATGPRFVPLAHINRLGDATHRPVGRWPAPPHP